MVNSGENQKKKIDVTNCAPLISTTRCSQTAKITGTIVIESVRICGSAFGGYPINRWTYMDPWDQMQITLRKRLKKSSPTYIMWNWPVRIDWWTQNQHSGSGTLRKSSVKSRNRGCGSEARKIEKIKISIFLMSGLYCTRTGSVIILLSLLTS